MELGAGSRMPVVLGAVGRADGTWVGTDLPCAAFSDGQNINFFKIPKIAVSHKMDAVLEAVTLIGRKL